MKVGFIGVGNMGGPMCRNIIKRSNHQVTVFDSFVWSQREVSFNDIAAELKRWNAKGAAQYESVPIAWERSAYSRQVV